MKRIIVAVASSLLALTACNKTESSGNTGVLKADSTTSRTATDDSNEASIKTQERVYRYVAEDGTSAKVTFVNKDKENYITVFSNGKTIRADQSTAGVYKNQDVEIRSQGDNITISQGNNVIGLKKAKGQ